MIDLLRRLAEPVAASPKKKGWTKALEDYIKHKEQLRIIESFATVDVDPAYHYKAERGRKFG